MMELLKVLMKMYQLTKAQDRVIALQKELMEKQRSMIERLYKMQGE